MQAASSQSRRHALHHLSVLALLYFSIRSEYSRATPGGPELNYYTQDIIPVHSASVSHKPSRHRRILTRAQHGCSSLPNLG